jgi:hypothetical protein
MFLAERLAASQSGLNFSRGLAVVGYLPAWQARRAESWGYRRKTSRRRRPLEKEGGSPSKAGLRHGRLVLWPGRLGVSQLFEENLLEDGRVARRWLERLAPFW